MCDSCSPTATKVIEDDLYVKFSQARNMILEDDNLNEHFGEAFEELTHGYARFYHGVFNGDYSDKQIEARQEQWEQRLESLKAQVEAFEKGELPTLEQQAEESLATSMKYLSETKVQWKPAPELR